MPQGVSTAIAEFGTDWVEYGLIERAYAIANPKDWAMLLKRNDHTHYHPIRPARSGLPYTASMYLARGLGALGRQGTLIHKTGPGTGRWGYNAMISYYAEPRKQDWNFRTTWEASGPDIESYMP